MKKKLPVSKNEDLILTIEDLTYQGMGVAKVDGRYSETAIVVRTEWLHQNTDIKKPT